MLFIFVEVSLSHRTPYVKESVVKPQALTAAQLQSQPILGGLYGSVRTGDHFIFELQTWSILRILSISFSDSDRMSLNYELSTLRICEHEIAHHQD